MSLSENVTEFEVCFYWSLPAISEDFYLVSSSRGTCLGKYRCTWRWNWCGYASDCLWRMSIERNSSRNHWLLFFFVGCYWLAKWLSKINCFFNRCRISLRWRWSRTYTPTDSSSNVLSKFSWLVSLSPTMVNAIWSITSTHIAINK